MSDEPKPPDTDPAARVASELRARLRSLPADELVELAAQLTTTYVLEGVVPLARANDAADLAADTTGEETFAQLLKRLKTQRRDPVLDRFLIDGENISVRIDGQGVLPLTEYRRPTQAPAGPGVSVQTTTVRQPSAPGAASSIYNRSLYQPEAAPPPSRSNPAPIQPPPAQQGQRPAAQQPGQPAGAPAQPKKEEGKDRFTLIELD